MILSFLIVPLIFCSCTFKKETQSEVPFQASSFPDGVYCAQVTCHYGEKGITSNYKLEIEIKDNKLLAIRWPKGGRLENQHFESTDISDGEAIFTSEKGVEYVVKVLGKPGSCVLDSSVINEDDMIERKKGSTIVLYEMPDESAEDGTTAEGSESSF